MIEEKLKDLILSRYKSVREFSQTADIPYTTVKSILSRGIGNASLNNIFIICKALHISVDALARGELKPHFTDNEEAVAIEDMVDGVRSKITMSDHLTINGIPVDINQVEPIIEGLDIGFEMVKRKTKLE